MLITEPELNRLAFDCRHHAHIFNSGGVDFGNVFSLRAQVRQLTQDNRSLQERLAGARDTNRFLDKRIAGLEAGFLAATRGQQEAPQCT